MQKKLIALAIAGLSSAAFAQSNVTVYGVADMYMANVRADGVKNTTAVNSGGLAGSRIGFKGTEALGNGTSALFVLEYAVGMDSNTGLLDASANQARQQLVGLTGGWGTAVAGYAQTAGYDYACGVSPVAGSALDPNGKVGSSFLLACGKAGRAGNAVAYISPSFGGGFTVAYNHARVTEQAGTAANAADDNYANLLSGTYANGPLKATLVWSQVKGTAGSAVTAQNITEWGLGGNYNFGVAKLYAGYQSKDTANTGDGKDSKWTLGVGIPVAGTGTIVVQYAKSTRKDEAGANIENDGKSWTLAYAHGLSKRTTLYTGYNRVTNGSGAKDLVAVSGIAPVNNGGSSSAFVAGINHSF